MLIEIKCTANLAKRATAWLKEAYNLIVGFDDIYTLITGDPSACVTPDLEAMGVPPEECLVLALDDKVTALNLECLYEACDQGYFGHGTAVKKYIVAFHNLNLIITNIKRKAQFMETFDADEMYNLKNSIYIALGNLIYAYGKILFMDNTPSDILAAPEEYTYSQDIQAFLAAPPKMTAEAVAQTLVLLQARYTTTIPLFENDIDAWRDIVKTLDPSLVDMLVDYGEYITVLDVKAIRQGCLIVNENFVELIRERAEDTNYIANLLPDGWARFVKMIPDNEVYFFLVNEFRITPELIEVALRDGELTPEYLKTLHQHFDSLGTRANPEAGKTNVFDSND